MTLEITPIYAVPIVLLMMLVAELRGVGGMWLHIAGILLVVSRALALTNANSDKIFLQRQMQK